VAEKKVANSVIALSSAAVLAIYGAGYARTREAADRFAQRTNDRRPHIPSPREDSSSSPGESAVAVPPMAAPVPSASPNTPAAISKATALAGSATAAASISADSPTAKSVTAATAKPTDVPVIDEAPSVPASSMAATPATPAPPFVVVPPVEPAKPAYKDGTYYGWGTSRHGDIQAEVVIEEGRITVARVEKCLTRYSCNWVAPIPPRILIKQSTTYDYVSGGTESSDAFQEAVSEALSQAK
jgi:uncharacterized protein with FMN-binding domain